ncbi:hypothetical protein IWQ60_001247 [Tieghemiomyces parasiticus]|uniref:PDZ GRASP-type domain-containing protein n=1 Tax=Tieghemiomyces parasiticus TaxID=78921 RepID=A0A9W8AEN1_9FUNG|nr:hypothetical protein IWQ60_001454 [Tieghemiomyces parasiticus]KAJ1929329.1 hypothetical protein IWQ60_001247 [Tieghemiomyces parasiticus]
MGAEQSAENPQNVWGFHVLQVFNRSPAFEVGLVPYFDFIVSVNDHVLTEADAQTLIDAVQSHIDQPVRLGVYSAQQHTLRQVELVPRRAWSDDPQQGVLGCLVRFCNARHVEENVWHVLDVTRDSPAFAAGLHAHQDYIVGTPEAAFHNEMDFSYMVAHHVGRPLKLLVYNSKLNTCRQVSITPSRDWGGEGLLGCDIGFGYLHRIPKTGPAPLEPVPSQ